MYACCGRRFYVLCLIAFGSITFGTLRMESVLLDVDPQRGQPFVQLSDGSVRNDFTFDDAKWDGVSWTPEISSFSTKKP